MADIALEAEPRTEQGSSAARRLRAAGRVPAVIYGHGASPLPISVDARALRQAFTTESGENALINLSLGADRHLAMARELQRHPVRHTISHVDFLVVRRDEVVTAEVPLVLVGEALTVTRGGGTVDQAQFTVHVKARPSEIPAHLEVDISELGFEVPIRVSDLNVPRGVTVDLDPETTLVTGIAPRGTTTSALAGLEGEAHGAAGEES